ncbi:UNVERIFIED_CONTAM: hypothetical protein Sradi_4907400 [Sesamum radiatum]|uniref:Uncharacterized protein n=1 Tax=Sesamum radiatum TaxID=300843 RepID=A0AAW2MCG7_SESRA
MVFEDVDGRPGAHSSVAKGTEDGGVEVELYDTVLPDGMLETMLHGEAPDGGIEKVIPVSQSTPDNWQGVEDLEPVVPEETLPQPAMGDGPPRVCVGQAGSCAGPTTLTADPRVE